MRKTSPFPAYVPAFHSEARYVILYGGAGSGKSHFGHWKELAKCLTGKHGVLCVQKVAATLRDTCFSLFLKILDNEFGAVRGVDYIANSSTMRITFPKTKSFIIFRGLDNVEKLKSIVDIDRILIEEATNLEERDLTQLSLRVRGVKNAQITLMFNPISVHHWLKKRFFDDRKDDCMITHTTYQHNPIVAADESYLKDIEAMRERDPHYYDVYVLGKFGDISGDLILRNWTTCTPAEYDNIRAPKFYGLDFGFVHPTALVEMKYKDGKVYTREIIYKGMDIKELLATFKQLKISKTAPIYADYSEKGEINLLRQAGYDVFNAYKGVETGIKIMRAFDYVICSSSQNTINEVREYRYKKNHKGLIVREEPVKENDDAVDAMRYGSVTHLRNNVKLNFYK